MRMSDCFTILKDANVSKLSLKIQEIQTDAVSHSQTVRGFSHNLELWHSLFNQEDVSQSRIKKKKALVW